MSAVALVARADARRRVMSGVILAVLIGVASGAVLTAWAGARRTESAHERVLTETNNADVNVTRAGGATDALDPQVVRRAPGVRKYGVVDGYGAIALDDEGLIDLRTGAALLVSHDGTAFFDINRPLITEGRRARPGAPDELMVDRFSAAHGYPVGHTIELCAFNFADTSDFQDILTGQASKARLRDFVDQVCDVHSFRVVGVTKGADDEVGNQASEDSLFVYGTPALAKVMGPPAFNFSLVDLEPHADVQAFVDYLLARAPKDSGISVQSTELQRVVVSRTVAPAVLALQLFALVGALASVGILGPALLRWASTADSEARPLLAMGVRRRQLRSIAALRGAVVGVLASAVATVVVGATSSRFPIGLARRIEPHPGVRLDAFVLVIGITALVVICVGLSVAAPLVRAPRRLDRSRLAEAVQRTAAKPSLVTGIRAAFSRDSNGPGPFVTLGGVAIALAAVAAALSFQGSLAAMVDEPARWGWTWDAIADGSDDALPPKALKALRNSPDVTALMFGQRGSFTRAGGDIAAFSFTSIRGDLRPTIVRGRAPHGTTEVALGGQTLRRLHLGFGDRVEFQTSQGRAVTVTVVGQALLPLPAVGQEVSIGEGALIDAPLMKKVGLGDTSLALVRFRRGVTVESFVRSLGEHNDLPFNVDTMAGPTLTGDLKGYESVRRTPLALAGLLSLLGLGVLAHTVSGSATRRRRELAILRCLGFLRADLRATIRWSALAIVAVCVVVFLPIGVAAGRLLWRLFAQSLGVVDSPVTELWPLVAVAGAALVSAAALSIVPARRAARIKPALTLASE